MQLKRKQKWTLWSTRNISLCIFSLVLTVNSSPLTSLVLLVRSALLISNLKQSLESASSAPRMPYVMEKITLCLRTVTLDCTSITMSSCPVRKGKLVLGRYLTNPWENAQKATLASSVRHVLMATGLGYWPSLAKSAHQGLVISSGSSLNSSLSKASFWG